MLRPRTFLPVLVALSLSIVAAGCTQLPSNRNPEKLEPLLKAGVASLTVGDYDEAVRLFDEGLALSPSQPTFLTNKSIALRLRGVARFNASLKLDDEAARASEKATAKRDIDEAAVLAAEAVDGLKSADVWDVLSHANSYETNRLAAVAAKAEALRLLASRFDKSRADEALAAAGEYMEVETDGERRLKAHVFTGQMLLDAGRGAESAKEYRIVLAAEPDNLDATLGAGLALFQTGDRTQYGEAAQHLRRFVERAPENHPLRVSAKEALDFMSQYGVPPDARGRDTRR